MKSRRLTGCPPAEDDLSLYHAEGCIVHHGKFRLPMSAMGQEQTSAHVRAMSALTPKADILRCGRPLLFDHLIGSAKQRKRNANAKRFGRLEV
jgi:hypothetical protein